MKAEHCCLVWASVIAAAACKGAPGALDLDMEQLESIVEPTLEAEDTMFSFEHRDYWSTTLSGIERVEKQTSLVEEAKVLERSPLVLTDQSASNLMDLLKKAKEDSTDTNTAANTGGGGTGGFITYNTLRFKKQDGNDLVIQGQRDPQLRYDLLDVDLTGKSHLDIGCNSGAMLFAQSERATRSVGVDFDAKMIDVGSEIAKITGQDSHVAFHRFDANSSPLDSLLQYLPENQQEAKRFDFVSLFAVNMWVDDPETLIDWAVAHSGTMLIEVNGDHGAGGSSKQPAGGQQKLAIDALDAACAAASKSVVEKTDYNHCPPADCNNRRLFVCSPAHADISLA